MSTRQQMQLLHRNHKHLSQLTIVALVLVSSWLMITHYNVTTSDGAS